MQYDLELENTNIKTYRIITGLMILLNIVALSIQLFTIKIGLFAKSVFVLCILACSIFLILKAAAWINKKMVPDTWRRFLLMLSAIAWMASEWWWVAIVLLGFDFLDYSATRHLVVSVSPEKIIYPSLFQKNIDWAELSNLVLKDGLLTIDFKNNRLIQQAVISTGNPVDEAAFNRFCREYLAKAAANNA